jgi:gliding motility-associated-like protein
MEKEFDKSAIPSFQTSTVSNSSSVFHLGIVYGRPHIDKVLPLDSVSTGCRYGYFSNFGKADINISIGNQCLQQGQNLVINPGNFDQYYWYKDNTFLHSNTILEINQGGDYSLKITDLTGCSDSTGFTISLGTIPNFNLPVDTILCAGEQIKLQIENGTEGDNPDYNWYFQPKGNIGFTAISNDSFFLAKKPGMYKLTVNTPECGSYSDSVDIDQWNVFVPNLFTPNNDQHNDSFYIPGIDKGIWMLAIYNRWGDRVFYSENYTNNWQADDAKDKEHNGLLFYYLEEKTSKQCNTYKGWVEVIK